MQASIGCALFDVINKLGNLAADGMVFTYFEYFFSGAPCFLSRLLLAASDFDVVFYKELGIGAGSTVMGSS